MDSAGWSCRDGEFPTLAVVVAPSSLLKCAGGLQWSAVYSSCLNVPRTVGWVGSSSHCSFSSCAKTCISTRQNHGLLRCTGLGQSYPTENLLPLIYLWGRCWAYNSTLKKARLKRWNAKCSWTQQGVAWGPETRHSYAWQAVSQRAGLRRMPSSVHTFLLIQKEE